MEEASLNVDKNIIKSVKEEIGKVIVGQEYMIDRIIIGLLTGGHILVEGVPGLAKSLTASTVAKVVGVDFKRIQFTPDLLPADIIGTEIYNQKTGEFVVKKDEINRAPAKVQSALLEAMQEMQVTIGEKTYLLDKPFFVIATQNPLEQQGTYPLPEAQQDRFMLKLKIQYPGRDEERIIMENFSAEQPDDINISKLLSRDDVFELRKTIDSIFVHDDLNKGKIALYCMRRIPARIH